MTLRTRLLLALLALVAAGLLVAGAVTYSSLRSFLLQRVDQQLVAARGPVLDKLASSQVPGVGPGGSNFPPGTYGELRDTSGVVLSKGSFYYGTTAPPTPKLPTPLPGASSSATSYTLFNTASSGTPNVQFRVLVQAWPQLGRVLVVAIPLTDTLQTLSRLLGIEVLVSVLVLVALAAAAWLLIKRDLRPLESMAATAGEIAAGDLTQRVGPAEPKTEVGRLGLALNAMLEQIERAFAERTRSEEKLRRFVADASHELRTPLTSIRGYAEVFHRAKQNPDDVSASMRRIEEESKRMGVLVDELLQLARLGETRQPEHAPVDLAHVVADAVSDTHVAAPERHIDLVLPGEDEAPGELAVMGDDHQLRQVIANLLGNALRHTPDGTPVYVALSHEAGWAVLEVSDEGPGLPPGDPEKLFEPFYRADPSRTRETGGTGLGLAIVAAIVGAHGGQVRAAARDGAGATFTVRLPLAGSPGAEPRGTAAEARAA